MNHLVEELEGALAAAEPNSSEGAGLRRTAVPRALLVPARSRVLLRQALEEWGLMGLSWIGLIWLPIWTWPVLILVLAGRYHALGVVLHDAVHMPLRRKSADIRVMEILCGYPLGTTLEAMRYHHLRHHRDSCMPEDPYLKLGSRTIVRRVLLILRGVLLVPFWHLRAWIGIASRVFPAWKSPYRKLFLQDLGADSARTDREVRECARAESGLLAFQVALGLVAFGAPSLFLWGYVVPLTFASLLAARRVLIEHTHELVHDRTPATLLASTRDNHLGWLGQWLLAPRNIGFHVVHHLHPQVCLGALPRLRGWYLENCRDYPVVGVSERINP